MEGERAFAADLAGLKGGKRLARERKDVPFRYSTGGGVHVSNGWESLGPAGRHGTFGPELSFASTLSRTTRDQIAVAKFTHSGSQILDWTPEGSDANARDLYPAFLAFVRDSVASLEARGHDVELAGIVYHVGENDMSFHPYRRAAAERVAELVRASRRDLARPSLRWYLSQQAPTDLEHLQELDAVSDVARFAESDEHTVHLPLEGAPKERALVMEAAGVVWLGEWLAERVAEHEAARGSAAAKAEGRARGHGVPGGHDALRCLDEFVSLSPRRARRGGLELDRRVRRQVTEANDAGAGGSG